MKNPDFRKSVFAEICRKTSDFLKNKIIIARIVSIDKDTNGTSVNVEFGYFPPAKFLLFTVTRKILQDSFHTYDNFKIIFVNLRYSSSFYCHSI